MPNATDAFSLLVFIGISGSIGFTGDAMRTLQPAGGAFTAAFTYTIGDPPATEAFQATVDGTPAATGVSVTPAAPVTQRQPMDGSPSEMEDVPPNEVQSGSVSGTIPVNTSTSVKTYTVNITMVQPNA